MPNHPVKEILIDVASRGNETRIFYGCEPSRDYDINHLQNSPLRFFEFVIL